MATASRVYKLNSKLESLNEGILDANSDTRLTPSEKTIMLRDWQSENSQRDELTYAANQAHIVTELSTYEAAFQALSKTLNKGIAWTSGIPSILAEGEITSDIDGVTLRNQWSSLYIATAALQRVLREQSRVILELSTDSIKRKRDKTLEPASLTATSKRVDKTPYPGRFRISLSHDGQAYQDVYSSSTDEASKIYTVPATITVGAETHYVTSVRVQLYAAGGFETLLGTGLCSVVIDPVAKPEYWGSRPDAPTTNILPGDYYLDSRAPATSGDPQGGVMRQWTGSAWVVFTDAMPGYADARSRALLDVVKWAADQGQTTLAAAVAVINSLWAYDVSVGRSLRAGGRYGVTGAVENAAATGVFQNANGTFKVGSPKGEFIVDAATGDVQIVDLPLRSYTGEGVQRRAVQIDDGTMDWLDCPATNPPTPERLRARIGRLGVGGAILMDGEFYSPCDLPPASSIVAHALSVYKWSTEVDSGLSLCGSEAGAISAIVPTTNRYPQLVRINNGSVGTPYTYSGATQTETVLVRTDDGRVIYIYDSYAAFDVTSSFPGVYHAINVQASGYSPCNLNGIIDNKIYFFFSTANELQTLNIDTWYYTAPVAYTGIVLSSIKSIFRVQDNLYAFGLYSTGYGVQLFNPANNSFGSVVAFTRPAARIWGSYSIITLAEEILVAYIGDAVNYPVYVSSCKFGEWTWSASKLIGYASTSYPRIRISQDMKGTVWIEYENTSNQISIVSLQRYARIGAGIIESGYVSGRGRYVKYSDGTMEQWKPLAWALVATSPPKTQNKAWMLPMPFIDTDYVIVATATDAGGESWFDVGAIAWNGLLARKISVNQADLGFYPYQKATSQTVRYDGYVKGRWKA